MEGALLLLFYVCLFLCMMLVVNADKKLVRDGVDKKTSTTVSQNDATTKKEAKKSHHEKNKTDKTVAVVEYATKNIRAQQKRLSRQYVKANEWIELDSESIDALSDIDFISEWAKQRAGISDVCFDDDNTELGIRVHKELADYYSEGSVKTLESLSEPVARQIAENLPKRSGMKTEFPVSLNGKVGKCDVVVLKQDVCLYLADFKTSKNIHGKYLEYCKEQLKLYWLALKNNGYNVESTIVEIVCPDGIIPVNIVKDSAISSTSAQGMGKWNQNEPFPWGKYFNNIEKQRQTSKK